MSIPTSLIVVLLVVAWLVVLVPMVARRRERVPQDEAETGSSGFRVLRRASASLRRRPARRPKGQTVTNSDAPDAPKSAAPKLSAQTTTTQGFAGGNVIDAPEVLVTVGAEQQPQDAAEEWAVAHAGNRVRSGSHPAFRPAADEESVPSDDDHSAQARPAGEQTVVLQTSAGDRVIAGSSPYRPQPDMPWRAEPAVAVAPDYQEQPAGDDEVRSAADEANRIPDEVDEQEWAEHSAA